jgi:hypothetical protein
MEGKKERERRKIGEERRRSKPAADSAAAASQEHHRQHYATHTHACSEDAWQKADKNLGDGKKRMGSRCRGGESLLHIRRYHMGMQKHHTRSRRQKQKLFLSPLLSRPFWLLLLLSCFSASSFCSVRSSPTPKGRKRE